MNGEKPFKFENTPGRLSKQVVPVEYAVRIVPDLNSLTFTGTETIKLNVRAPVSELVFNALELDVISASIDDKDLPKSAIKVDKKGELVRIALPKGLPFVYHTLALSFSGKINQQGQGLFYARYQEEGTGKNKILLGTQFEATDARRMFPCWDEPSFRSQFQLTVVVPENWLAVSNMPVESEQKDAPPSSSASPTQTSGVAGATKEVRFAMTPPMSSYLNVLVAGELDFIETKVGGTKVRVIATKGKAEWGRYALESTAKILKYYNDYFGEPYPLPKLDQIAIPGGFGGAMENWGGITYFESVLLFDPEKSSERTRQNVFEVIAHEVAHMWFGDLVTMAWWDNLWLNEGFASWMGTKCTTHFNPQWEVWLQRNVPRDPARRAGISKEQAMEGDARSTTHPIQQPITTEAEANSAFDDITYKKGQSFLRMLESFLGEDVFREGIRGYMEDHKLSNTTTADLWKSLSKASGKPVGEIAAAWTEQPAFPLVKVTREGGKIHLAQERFTTNFQNAPALQWKIPLTYFVVGEGNRQSRLMSKKTDSLENIPADKAVKINADGAGNYRVEYDEASWQLLMESLPRLSVDDRVNLLSDTWALVQANRVPFSRYLILVDKLPGSTELAEQEQIINVFDFVNGLLRDRPEREKFMGYARSVLRRSFNSVGWDPRPNEPAKTGRLRSSLIQALGELNDPEIASGCRERFDKYLKDPKAIPPDLRPSILNVVGRNADEATWNHLRQLGMKTTSVEEKQNYYYALAAATDPKLMEKTLPIALSDELPTSRAAFLVTKAARESEHPEIAWDFAKKNMQALLAKSDALAANMYAPGFFTFFSDPARVAELRSYARTNLPAESKKSVAKAVDEVEFRAELKSRLTSQLAFMYEKK